ncbi:MAG: exodeoxyribonuclease III [Gammaproteobacteria bacterium]
MRIATWNVNGLRARLDFVRHWLAAREPDVVGLQEVKAADDVFPHEAFEELGYQVLTHGQAGWNGVAILSRAPLEVVERGLPGQSDAGARFLAVNTAGLSFTTVYCPNGKDVSHPEFPEKLEWFDALVEHCGACCAPDNPAVLCGDFNIVPGDLDSHHPDGFEEGIFHTAEERARFEALTALGFVDLFRAKYPDVRAFSWWDYRAGAFHRNLGLRIDFLLGTQPILDRTREIVIDRDYRKKKEGLTASDHAPVYADLDWD